MANRILILLAKRRNKALSLLCRFRMLLLASCSRKVEQTDTRRYNSGTDLGMVSRVVRGGIMDRPEGFALAAMGETGARLGKGYGIIPKTVLGYLDRRDNKS